MPEKLVPLLKDSQRVEIAVTPQAFMTVKAVPKDEHTFQTYAEAGYTLWDFYESMEPYQGPKTLAEFEREAEERRVAKQKASSKADSRSNPEKTT